MAILATLVAAFAGLVAIIFAAMLVRSLVRLAAARNWQQASATVNAIAVRPAGAMAGADGIPGGIMYALQLEATYRAGSGTYVCRNVDLGPARLYRTREKAFGALQAPAAEPGSEIKIWYNPARPEESVALRRVNIFWPLIAALGLGAASLFLAGRVYQAHLEEH